MVLKLNLHLFWSLKDLLEGVTTGFFGRSLFFVGVLNLGDLLGSRVVGFFFGVFTTLLVEAQAMLGH